LYWFTSGLSAADFTVKPVEIVMCGTPVSDVIPLLLRAASASVTTGRAVQMSEVLKPATMGK
jgi:hypothetical protein